MKKIYFLNCMRLVKLQRYAALWSIISVIFCGACDGMRHHANRPFSTKDRDNDAWDQSCAQTYKGAWWYGSCTQSNLNGLYLGGPHTSYGDGIEWLLWHRDYYSLKKVTMRLRP